MSKQILYIGSQISLTKGENNIPTLFQSITHQLSNTPQSLYLTVYIYIHTISVTAYFATHKTPDPPPYPILNFWLGISLKAFLTEPEGFISVIMSAWMNLVKMWLSPKLWGDNPLHQMQECRLINLPSSVHKLHYTMILVGYPSPSPRPTQG